MRRWKLSPMDLESITRWEDYSGAKDEMFVHTDIPEAPWFGRSCRITSPRCSRAPQAVPAGDSAGASSPASCAAGMMRANCPGDTIAM
jgi:hypothetical protein